MSYNHIKSCVSFMIVLYDYVPFDRLDNIIKAICFIMTTPSTFLALLGGTTGLEKAKRQK